MTSFLEPIYIYYIVYRGTINVQKYSMRSWQGADLCLLIFVEFPVTEFLVPFPVPWCDLVITPSWAYHARLAMWDFLRAGVPSKERNWCTCISSSPVSRLSIGVGITINSERYHTVDCCDNNQGASTQLPAPSWQSTPQVYRSTALIRI